ncbi:MAG: transglycosylase domain-containing protein [Schleiferiaceae bacterium]
MVKAGVFGPMPTEEQLTTIDQDEATVVTDRFGNLVGSFYQSNRIIIGYDEIPHHLSNALIATEDVRFFEHSGIDWRSWLRVFFKSIVLQDRSGGGGSTLTQQLAKNLFGRASYGFLSMPVNKCREIIIAQQLEEIYTKEEILTLYLNTVPFGENTLGIESAALRYYGKNTSELSIEESAVLVGLLKANTYYNPRLNPENALFRRNVVLGQMEKYEFITEDFSDSVRALPLTINYYNLAKESPAPYALRQIKKEAIAILKETGNYEDGSIDREGLVIKTTLDRRLQDWGNKALADQLEFLQSPFDRDQRARGVLKESSDLIQREIKKTTRYKRWRAQGLTRAQISDSLKVEREVLVYDHGEAKLRSFSMLDSIIFEQRRLFAGFVAMVPQDGAIRVWVGGVDHSFFPYDQVLAERQTASTFKPIVYASALESGVSPCSYIENVQRDYDGYSPGNANNQYGGFYSLRGALKNSLNVVSVALQHEIGANSVVQTARQLGLKGKIDPVPSMALGVNSSSLKEMVPVYAAFANGGNLVTPYFITEIKDAAGKTLYSRPESSPQRAIHEETAFTMTQMLRQVVEGGTAQRIRSQYHLKGYYAGKTGTAQDYADGWFIGFSPELVAGARVGASSPSVHFSSGAWGAGSRMALPIWARFFEQIEKNKAYHNLAFTPFAISDSTLLDAMDCPDFKEGDFWDDVTGFFSGKDDIIYELRKDSLTRYQENQKPLDEDKSRNPSKNKKKDRSFWDKVFGRNK